MKNYKTAIFDLDGTLLDTSEGIMESVCYATSKYGYPDFSEEILRSFVGPPLVDSFRRCLGCSEAEAKKLTAAYREFYPRGAMFHAVPYEGIFEVCSELKNAGLALAVATNKPLVFAEQVISHFGLGQYFDFIHGADMEGVLKKSDLIRLCMEDTCAMAHECIMVGDSEHDAKGAMEAGVPFLFVSYGFGAPEKVKEFPVTAVAGSPREIIPGILG